MEPSDRPQGFWRELFDDQKHGSIPAVLLILTATTGIVDAVSILSLGRVFVANMTGNVVFVGLALAGAKDFSLAASLFALAGFLVGALGGGWTMRRLTLNRAHLLRSAVGVELGLLTIALIAALVAGTPLPSYYVDGIAVALAISLGLQNAVVRRLGVPDLTTTVLTMTLTGIAADTSNGDRKVIGRRVLAVATMFCGAVGGALLVLHVSPSAALGLAVTLMAIAFCVIAISTQSDAAWQV